MSRARSTLATVSLVLSLALSSASVLAQPSPSPPDPGQSPAAPPDDAAAQTAAPSSTAPASTAPAPDAAAAQTAAPSATTAPASTAPPPEVEPPVAGEPRRALFRASAYNSLTVGFPMGSIYSNVPLANAASRVVQFEAGPDLMIGGRVIVGFNVALGLLTLADAFDTGCRADNVSCAGVTFNFGAHLDVLLMPAGGSAVPWIGAETGYEVLALSRADGANSSFYLGNQLEIRAGVDFHFRKQGGWGPFIAYQLGTYTSQDVTDNSSAGEGGMEIQNQSGHGWLLFGVRGRL